MRVQNQALRKIRTHNILIKRQVLFLCAATAALAKWNIMLRSKSSNFSKKNYFFVLIRVKEKEANQRISVRDKVCLQLSRNQMVSSFLEI